MFLWRTGGNYPRIITKYSLTLVVLNPDIPCLCKQCRSRSVGFFSWLIWICTVCHSVFEFISTTWIKQSDWLKIGNGRGILIYSAGQGLTTPLPIHPLLSGVKKKSDYAECLHMDCKMPLYIQSPVVQSVVSLTSSLWVISLTVLADSIYNILIFFAEKM